MENKKIKTIFMGTPDIACAGLKSLLEDNRFQIDLVVSQMDKAANRNLKIQKTAVKEIAELNNLRVLQSEEMKIIQEEIAKIEPDLIVVIAYGKILPRTILEIPKVACINVHASLLPKYRGSACIQAALLNKDKETGITIMKMDEKMDTGNIIEKFKIQIDQDDNCQDLISKIKLLIENNLSNTLIKYLNKEIEDQKQNDEEASYVKLIKKEDGHFSKEDDAQTLAQKIKAYHGWPGVFAYINKDLPKQKILFKMLSSKDIIEDKELGEPGQLMKINKDLAVQCKNSVLVLKEIQLEGKKPGLAKDIINGNNWIIGKILE